MHPTIDEQLGGAQRLLDQVAEDPGLSAGSREQLVNVRRLLTQATRSWAVLPEFLRADNQELGDLLESLAPLLPERPPVAAGEPVGVRDLAERNVLLRGALSDAIAFLPADPTGDAARRRIGEHLRRRVAADPS